MLSANQIKSLRYSANGSPTVMLVTKRSLNPESLIFSEDGSPWYALGMPSVYPVTFDSLTITVSFGAVTVLYNTAVPISIVQPYIVVYMWKRTA